MSTDTTDEDRPSPKGTKKKDAPTDRDRATVEPIPKDEEFFLWLERLFDGSQNFPEYLDVRVVRGKDFATMGPRIRQIPFPSGVPKPTREKLVAMSNEILHLVQRDCDQQRREVVYHVAAFHFNRSDEPYERFLIRRKAGPTYRNGESGASEDDEENNIEKRFSSQVLRHQEQMVGLLGAGYEGIIDRQDRTVQRLLDRIEKLETKNAQITEQLERALSNQIERDQQKAWNEMKIQNVQKALDLGMAVMPPLLNQLAGKQVVPTNDTAETITLKNFFKTTKEGGKLTEEQANAAFGTWDEKGTLIKPGILTYEQSAILYEVAHGKRSPDDLDKLMPGGPYAVSMEQFVALQQVFTMEQLAPIGLIFQARQAKQQGGGR